MHLTREKTDMALLLEINNLSISFDDDKAKAVDGLSLSIGEGQTLALVGESGSGKSVSALSILRLLDERHASYPTGSIHFQGENMLSISSKRLRQIRGQ
jgi:microcin C transport system ATP-binding protein